MVNKCSIFGHQNLLYFDEEEANICYMLALMQKFDDLLCEGITSFITCLQTGIDLLFAENLAGIIKRSKAINKTESTSKHLHDVTLSAYCHTNQLYSDTIQKDILEQATQVHFTDKPLADAFEASFYAFAVFPVEKAPSFFSNASGKKSMAVHARTIVDRL